MADRSRDWLRQAERDLEQAQDSKTASRHEWACFASHQAAEKAVKALHLFRGQDASGHAVDRLLRELPTTELLVEADALDMYYIPSRYPNGFSEGAPFEHFNAQQSGQAIEYARQIIAFVRSQMA